MIQRIQSLYLLLTTLSSILFLNGSILKFIKSDGQEIILKFNGVYQVATDRTGEILGKALPYSLLSVLIPLLSVAALLLFKRRKLQAKMTLILILLEIMLLAASAFYIFSTIKNYGATLTPGIKMIIPLLTIIFSILAFRGIKKDEDLVKSYDRMR
jgi:uncharacterized membrane protein